MFQGFTDKTVDFLWEIRFNNERAWFQDHKQTYLDQLYEPMKELAAQVQEELMAACPELLLTMKVSRIYRDARRLHGKGPYKDHLWFGLRTPVEDWSAVPAFYFEISPEGYEYGMGYYCTKPVMMEDYRKGILREPEKLSVLAKRLAAQEEFVLSGEEYKRPKGQTAPELTTWFNRKNIFIGANHPHDALEMSPHFAKHIAQGFLWLMPYYKYFEAIQVNHIS